MSQTNVSGLPGALRNELRRGEIVKWAGAPEGRMPLRQFAIILVFALVWLGFCLAWEASTLGFFWDAWFGKNVSRTPPWLAALMAAFGAPFVAVGFGMLAIPWLMARKRRNTLYAVTDQRLVTLEQGRIAKVSSIEARQIFRVTRIDRANGFGDVEIARSTKTDSDGDLLEATVTLESLRDPRGAEAALSALARR